MDATTVAVDLAKDIFEVAMANRANRITERKRLTRRQFERFIDTLPAGTEVIMEGCGTAHYWGRRCQARDLRVRLLPVQYVRPYVRRHKTDRTDTEALLEANRCGGIQPVPVKTVDRQTLQALHRVRTQWQAARTARINVVRGLLREQGLPIPVGARRVLARVMRTLEDADAALPDLLRQTVALVVEEIRALETRIAAIDHQLAYVARTHPVAVRLQQGPGVGVITATALVGAVAHIHAFRRGRQFASWLGLTPRESSTGSRRFLGRISKRGDVCLRCLIDANGRESDFIDMIIYDRQFTPPVFNTLYIPAESVYAVIEAKQTLTPENVIYAGKKAQSVRLLRRTAGEIVDARGKVEKRDVKKPFRITAGIATYKSSWGEPFGDPLKNALRTLATNQQIDFGISVDNGYFEVDYKRGSR